MSLAGNGDLLINSLPVFKLSSPIGPLKSSPQRPNFRLQSGRQKPGSKKQSVGLEFIVMILD
jgi:hypothetical protein